MKSFKIILSLIILSIFLAVSIQAEKITSIETNKLNVKEQTATPILNPAAGRQFIYPKIDGFWYGLTSAGVETCLNPLIAIADIGSGTLSELNSKLTDATLIDTADSRLSDARIPTIHAASHIDGTDDIQSATNAQKGLATAAHITAVEANTAKITESTIVSAPLVKTGVNITIPQATTSIDGYLSSADWNTFYNKGSGSGDVVGPASSTDNTVPRFDSTTGKIIQTSALSISDNGKLTIPDNSTEGALKLAVRSLEPSAPSAGDIYLDDGSNTTSTDTGLRYYTGTVWEDISGGGGTTGNEVSGTFVDADLSSGILTITHTYGTWYPSGFSIYNNNDKLIPFADEMTVSNNTITLDLSSLGTLTGTWQYYAGDAVSSGGSGSSTFLGLSDTPSSFTAGKWLKVNAGGTAIEESDAPSGASTFLDLTDTPSSFTAGKYLKVNATGTGLEETDAPSGDSAVTALGTSGAQTINRITSDKWTLTPSGAVTLTLTNFTTNQEALLIITNGGTDVSWADDITWDLTYDIVPPVLQSAGYDVIRLISDGTSNFVGEHVAAWNAYPATSYSNTGGTGDRTSIITVTNEGTTGWLRNGALTALIDGDNAGGQVGLNTFAASGVIICFDFGTAYYINELKFYIYSESYSHGMWVVKGSDDKITWSSALCATTELTNNPTVFDMGTNDTSYRYYGLFGVSGNINGDSYFSELEFKISE